MDGVPSYSHLASLGVPGNVDVNRIAICSETGGGKNNDFALRLWLAASGDDRRGKYRERGRAERVIGI